MLYLIDLDPRFIKLLYQKGDARTLALYMEHIRRQAFPILDTQEIHVLGTTPVLIQALAPELKERGYPITGFMYGGTHLSKDLHRLLRTEFFPNAVHTAVYGNTLMGGARLGRCGECAPAGKTPGRHHRRSVLTVFVPAIIGKGQTGYRSTEHKALAGFDGSMVAAATITPPLLVNMAARGNGAALRSIPIRKLLEIFGRAADLFAQGEPDGLAPEAYVRNASLTSGLPLSITRRQTLGIFPRALRIMERFIAVQSPAGMEGFDSHCYETAGIRVGLVPRGRNVGFVMPGNHPSTNFMWLSALAMKMPVILRPNYDDVFTPYRLVMALLEAGLPEDAVAFTPGAHDLVDAIVQACSLAVLFGTQQLEDRYSAQRSVKVYGPGRSKVVVLANARFEQAVEMICSMVMDDGGRGCVNASAVVVQGDAGALASAVATELGRVPVIFPLAEEAQLAALPRAAEAGLYNGLIGRSPAPGAQGYLPY